MSAKGIISREIFVCFQKLEFNGHSSFAPPIKKKEKKKGNKQKRNPVFGYSFF